jgi:hypothetical protein
MPEYTAVAKAAMTVLRESGVVRHRTFQAEPAEPPIGQIAFLSSPQAATAIIKSGMEPMGGGK